MPYGAFGATVTEPRVPLTPAPVPDLVGVGVADGLAAARAPMTRAPLSCVPACGVLVGLLVVMPAGTWETVEPSSTSTCPAGSVFSSVAVAPNWVAICDASAAVPAP